MFGPQDWAGQATPNVPVNNIWGAPLMQQQPLGVPQGAQRAGGAAQPHRAGQPGLEQLGSEAYWMHAHGLAGPPHAAMPGAGLLGTAHAIPVRAARTHAAGLTAPHCAAPGGLAPAGQPPAGVALGVPMGVPVGVSDYALAYQRHMQALQLGVHAAAAAAAAAGAGGCGCAGGGGCGGCGCGGCHAGGFAASLSASAPEFVMAAGGGGCGAGGEQGPLLSAGARPQPAQPGASASAESAAGAEPAAAAAAAEAAAACARSELSPTAREFQLPPTGGGAGPAEAAGAPGAPGPAGATALSPSAAEFKMGGAGQASPPELRLSVAAPEFRPSGAEQPPQLLLPRPAQPQLAPAPQAAADSSRHAYRHYARRGGGGEDEGDATLVGAARAHALGGALTAELRAELASELALPPEDEAGGAGARGAGGIGGSYVGAYHSLAPLDDRARGHTARSYGVPTALFRATRAADGRRVALRRVDGSGRVSASELAGAAATWLRVAHPNLVELQAAFLSDEMTPGQPRSFFAYAHVPAACTLEAAFFGALSSSACPAESLLWELAVQLLGLLYALHSLGLAARSLEPARLLLTPARALLLSGAGVADLTRPDGRPTAARQADDLASLGRLLVSLACASPAAASEKALPRSLAELPERYSAQFCALASQLAAGGASLADACALAATRILDHSVGLHAANDALRRAARAHSEGARLCRLLMKLGFVNERRGLGSDGGWAETGDRYLLKLLRDALFHTEDERGAPVVSYAHVVSGLCKLDVGSDEHLLLHGRDGDNSLLVVSYRDLRALLESAFAELVAAQEDAALEGEAGESELSERLSALSALSDGDGDGAGGYGGHVLR